MNKTILAFGASNSRQSINKQFANYAAHQIADAKVKLLDLNDFEMPIYSIDREREEGIPSLAYDFKQHIIDSDGIVISFAEHNGSYSVAFKNIFDWISRIDRDVWASKPMLLLATSPGGRGGKTVLEIAVNRFNFMSKGAITHFSLPSFRKNFDPEKGISDESLQQGFQEQLALFNHSMKTEALKKKVIK